MSLPVNLGDAIALLEQIYKLYDAYRTVPDQVRSALKKFEDTKNECERLKKILAQSRDSELRAWPGAEDFETDLKAALDYLKAYQPLVEAGTTRMARVKATTVMKWKWPEFEKHTAAIQQHRENMRAFRADVQLQMTLYGIELGIRQIQITGQHMQAGAQSQRMVPDDVVSVASNTDRMSLLSTARSSLRMVRQLQSTPSQKRLQLSPVLEGSSSMSSQRDQTADDLRVNLAGFIERRQLYTQEDIENAREEDLEYLIREPLKWCRSHLNPEPLPQAGTTLGSGSRASQFATGTQFRLDDIELSLGDSFGNSIFGALNYDQSSIRRTIAQSHLLPESAMDPDVSSISEISSTGSDEAAEISVEISEATITVPWIKAALPCQLKLIRSEGSLHIHSSTTKTFQPNKRPSIAGQTPSDLLNMASSLAGQSIPIIFSHAVLGGMSSFPKILHPTAEVESEEYPYVVEFYDHQYLKVEGYSGLERGVQGLRYSFKVKKDRDSLRQEIFGKELLASVGLSTVQFDANSKSIPKPCTTQAATLWRSRGESPELSITVQCSTKGKQTKPDCAREFIIVKYDLRKIEKVRNSEGKELELMIRPIDNTLSPLPSPGLSGGVLSSNSTASNVSTYSAGSENRQDLASPSNRSRRTSYLSIGRSPSIATMETIKPVKTFTCYIGFTENSSRLVRAKDRFLDVLKRNVQLTSG